MYQIWYNEFVTYGQVSLYNSLVSCKQILSVHVSDTARTVVIISDDILNNNESNKTFFSANVSNFMNADFEDGSLFVTDINIDL